MTHDADSFWEQSKGDSKMVKDTMNLEANKANRANSEFASNRSYDNNWGTQSKKRSQYNRVHTQEVSQQHIRGAPQSRERPMSAHVLAPRPSTPSAQSHYEARRNKFQGRSSSVTLGWGY